MRTCRELIEEIEGYYWTTKKVDPTGKRKRDDGNDSDDNWQSEMHREIAAIDREYEEGGRIARPSQRPLTQSRTQTRHTEGAFS